MFFSASQRNVPYCIYLSIYFCMHVCFCSLEGCGTERDRRKEKVSEIKPRETPTSCVPAGAPACALCLVVEYMNVRVCACVCGCTVSVCLLPAQWEAYLRSHDDSGCYVTRYLPSFSIYGYDGCSDCMPLCLFNVHFLASPRGKRTLATADSRLDDPITHRRTHTHTHCSW